MKQILLAVVAAAPFLTPKCARADWQYTRWGMLPQDVITASQRQVRSAAEVGKNSGTDVHRLTGIYVGSGYSFQADFLFDQITQGLSIVQLQAEKSAECNAIRSQLFDSYGPFSIGGHGISGTWFERGQGNRVDYLQTGLSPMQPGFCSITYRAIRPPGAKGGL